MYKVELTPSERIELSVILESHIEKLKKDIELFAEKEDRTIFKIMTKEIKEVEKIKNKIDDLL